MRRNKLVITAACVAALTSAMIFALGCATPDPVTPDPVTPVATGVVKRAVCVGLDNSQFAGACPGAGVDRDSMALLWRERGLAVETLADSKATRANALAALRRAIAGASQGSLLVLFWSGHGGQTADKNGDEADGLDEYLCPWDKPLLDDDLGTVLDTVPAGVRVLMIADTCNSGTIARKALRRMRPVSRACQASVILIAGCADGKSSYGSAQGGVLSTALVDSLTDTIGVRAWFDAAVSKMAAAGEEQIPQWTEYGPVTDEFRNARVGD